MSYLTIKDLSYSVFQEEEKKLLQHISLEVEKESFVVILGGNGAGKSTFFNVLDGTYHPTQGHVMLNKESFHDLPLKKQAQKISRVFQDPKQGTAPRMTVLENLMLAKYKGKTSFFQFSHAKIEQESYTALLKRSQNGLEHRLHQATETLSGGQRQALSLFMATIQKPELLLLDEHTAALDPKSGKKVMELTDELITQYRLTCLMITHNLEDALQFGNRLIILKQGQLVADFKEEEKKQLTKEQLYPYFY